MSPLARRTLLTSAIVLHLLADLAAIPLIYRLKIEDLAPFILGTLFGMLLGQISLLAAWLAWGRGHWLGRLCKCGLAVVLLWFCVTAGAKSTGDSFEIGSIEQLFAIVIGQVFVFVTLPYLALRGICRTRFTTLSDDQTAAAPSASQFGIRDLLIWTTAAAIGLAVLSTSLGRELWGRTWSVSGGEFVMFSLWMLIWAALTAIVAVPAAWACLGQCPPARRLRGVVILAAFVTAAESFSLVSLTGNDTLYFFTVALNLAICAEVVGCLLLLRLCGYRLELCPPRPLTDR